MVATVADAAMRCALVARLVDGEVVYGTARSVGDQEGRYLTAEDDVRDGYLRVTSIGWEVCWPVAELARAVHDGVFCVDVDPPR